MRYWYVAGTLFASTKLPLTTWFLALYLLTQTKSGVAALELSRHPGVCYRTAWRIKQKLMQAMAERDATCLLGGLVQIDNAYLASILFRYVILAAVHVFDEVLGRDGGHCIRSFCVSRREGCAGPDC